MRQKVCRVKYTYKCTAGVKRGRNYNLRGKDVWLQDKGKGTIIYQYCGFFWHGCRLYYKTSCNVNHETRGDLL